MSNHILGADANGLSPKPCVAAEQLPPAQSISEPLPRPFRQERRSKADRGLPPDSDLAQLASDYLSCQRKHWPALVAAGLLPVISDEVVTRMVDDFKNRHRTGQVSAKLIEPLVKYCQKLAGSYSRYSCDNSSPKSIIDQMFNGLQKARQEDRFVPWDYVFADYSVSGLNSSRQGYSAYKSVLRDSANLIETTYVDDFTRASRDEVEWWKLAQLSRRLHKRLIGASDGFDLSTANWDMMISVYGLLSRLFIKGLREKVKRGMGGAARRGGCLGKLSLGFTRMARPGEHGGSVHAKDGDLEYVPCIDPATCEYRKLLYELYVEKCWSLCRITKHFNSLNVDGWNAWTSGGVKKLLWSSSAIGVFIWNKTRREFDHEEEKWRVIRNPRKDWVIYYDRELAIVPMELWKAARKKLAGVRRNHPLPGRPLSRNQKSATTLFSGTLFCSYCKRELTLNRSAGKYRVMCCSNGSNGMRGCELSTTKSVRIIEMCLLGHFKEQLLAEASIEDLVSRANAYLEEEANKPRINTAPLKAHIRRQESVIKKLFGRIEVCDDQALIQAYDQRIAQYQREVNELTTKLREAEAFNAPAPAPLDVSVVRAMIADLRGLFNQEIPAAAEAIRALTGPINIRQEKIPGKKRGAKWIATFSPDFLGCLRQLARRKNYPDSMTLEYLSRRIWIRSKSVTIPIDYVPKYEEISAKVAALAAKGASVETIAASLGESWESVDHAVKFARTGRRPKNKPVKKTGNGKQTYKSIDIAEVIRLRDEQRFSFKHIAQQLGVSKERVVRAYDKGNPKSVCDAAEKGETPRRGRHSRLEPGVFERIQTELNAGRKPAQIAAEFSCGRSTVYRFRNQIENATRAKSGSERQQFLMPARRSSKKDSCGPTTRESRSSARGN